MTSYLSHLVYSGSHEKRETRMGTSGYDVYDVYLWILICVYSVVSHPCVIISMIKERTTITVGVIADSAVTPTVIVALFDSEVIALVLNLSRIYA